MTNTLRNMPRYIRNTDAFGWQGADNPDGPWRSITPPQCGTPWRTTSAMDDLRQASAEVSGVELEPGWRIAAGPAYDDLASLCSQHGLDVDNWPLEKFDAFWEITRAALARWGRPAPVAVAVSERLPEPSVKVLAYYFNDLGKGRAICAIWVPAKTRSDSYGDDDFTEYDEGSDTFYWPEGWYETIENWDDLGYGYVKVDEGEVIYWQPLPQWPAHALPLPCIESD